ncbi:unnamed protein product [Rangifer tarandus platyrhynchus]|uniref:Uncharacterized protein n=2 Tax=Rangifer tarandus platyrhynchus TaxID=3082113 RepID=A0ACB0F4A8_RANTA|nr:unnamed protein product [Rangifer tarandus platyrhynchus]CAI9707532.1 unnamed protein product [Rangifer tarandus platyrhynchus]
MPPATSSLGPPLGGPFAHLPKPQHLVRPSLTAYAANHPVLKDHGSQRAGREDVRGAFRKKVSPKLILTSGVPSCEGPPRAAFRRQPREPATLGRERRLRQCPRPQDDKDPARGGITGRSPRSPGGRGAPSEPPRSRDNARRPDARRSVPLRDPVPAWRSGRRPTPRASDPAAPRSDVPHPGGIPVRPRDSCLLGDPCRLGSQSGPSTPARFWDPNPALGPPPGPGPLPFRRPLSPGIPVRAREPRPTPGSQSGPGSPVRLKTPALLPVRPWGPPPGSGTPVRPRDPRPALGPQSGPGDPCPALGPQFGPGTPARLETPAPPWTQPGSGTPDSRGSPRPPETAAWP